MPYLLIEDFKLGVDRSRPIYAGKPGTLWQGINGHLTKGGDFEVRKAFVHQLDAPANTFGLQQVNGNLYVFGSLPPGGVSVPPPLFYDRLQHEAAVNMTAVLHSHLFDGKMYVVAQFVNGDVRHFYNSVIVPDWHTGASNPPPQNAKQLNTTAHFSATHQRKVYAPIDTGTLYFSGVDSATEWTLAGSPAGAGFFNPATVSEGSTELTALSSYQQNKLIIFARDTTQLWTTDTDPLNNAPFQVIENLGCIARKGLAQIGDIDVIFLSDSGIRSIKARESINFAAVSDIGTPIDKVVTDEIALYPESAAVGFDWMPARAAATIEPLDKRLLMAVGKKIFVYSYFPNSKIAGWTWYEPGFQVDQFAIANRRLWARSYAESRITGDVTDLWGKIYLYGGLTGDEYDTSPVTCWLPFLTGGKPAHRRDINGIDIGASGGWNVDLLVDPNNLNSVVHMGRLAGVTYNEADLAAVGVSSHVSVKLTRSEASPASLSNVAIHWEGDDSG